MAGAMGRAPPAAGLAVAAASMSRRMMRPPGPDPCIDEMSSPRSVANRRASGELRGRPPPLPAAAAGEVVVGAAATRGALGAGAPPVAFCGGGADASPCDCCGVFGADEAPACSCGWATTFSGAFVGVAAPPPDSATIASMFSSLVPITPTSCPTGRDSPSATSRLRSTPSPRATSSMTALSVSTSASTSPLFTASPSFLSHFTRRPSSIVGESASMKTLVAMSCSLLEVHNLLDRRDRLRGVRLRQPLEVLGVRHGNVGLVHANDRRVEIVKALALDVIHDLRADARELPALLEHDGAIRLRHRLLDRIDVHRPHRAKIHDVDANVFLRQLIRGLHRHQRHLAICHDRAVVA